MFPIEVGTWGASVRPWRERYGPELRGIGGMDKRVFARDFHAVDAEIERLKPWWTSVATSLARTTWYRRTPSGRTCAITATGSAPCSASARLATSKRSGQSPVRPRHGWWRTDKRLATPSLSPAGAGTLTRLRSTEVHKEDDVAAVTDWRGLGEELAGRCTWRRLLSASPSARSAPQAWRDSMRP